MYQVPTAYEKKKRGMVGAYSTYTSIPGTGTLPHMGVPMLQRTKYGLNSNYYLYEHMIDFNSSTNLLNDHGMDLSTHCA
jgi:hypothetical protein